MSAPIVEGLGYPDPYALGGSGGESSELEANLVMLALEVVAAAVDAQRAGHDEWIERTVNTGWRALVDGAILEAGDEGRRAAYEALRFTERALRVVWGKEAAPEPTP